jgi:hypothetical protein
MPIVYTLTALLSPAVQVPSSLLLPGTNPAVKASLLTPGTTALSTGFNLNAAHLDNLGALGGAWAYGVAYGLDLTDGGGLTLNIAAGGAHVGAVPTVAAAQTKALTNGSQNHVWLLRDGTISLRQNVITAPATAAAYLGRVTTLGGAITAIDYSGRVTLLGGMPYRKTADAGVPADTPSATVAYWNETPSELYLWTGTAYQLVGGVGAAGFAVEEVLAAQILNIPLYNQMRVFDGRLRVRGTLRVAGKVRIEA